MNTKSVVWLSEHTSLWLARQMSVPKKLLKLSRRAARLAPAAGSRALALALALYALFGFNPQILAATDSWVGNSSVNWTDPNWASSGNNPPITGDSLVFGAAGTSGLTLTDNLMTPATYNVAGITFSAGAAAFIINSGTAGVNGFTLTAGVINSSTALETINDGITLNAAETFTTTTGGGNITLGGGISGAGGITMAGTGTLTLNGTGNTYTGNTTTTAGTLLIDSPLGTSGTPTGTISAGGASTAAAMTISPTGPLFASALTANPGTGGALVGLTQITAGPDTFGSITVGRDGLNFNTTLQTAANTTDGLYIHGNNTVINDTGTLGIGTTTNSTSNMTFGSAGGTLTVTGLTRLARTATANRYDLFSITAGTVNANGGIELGGLGNTSGSDYEELLVTNGVLSLGTSGTLTFGGNTASSGACMDELYATGTGAIYLGSGGIVNSAPAGGTEVVSLGNMIIGANATFTESMPIGVMAGDTTTLQAANVGGTPESFTLGGVISGATGNLLVTGSGAVTLSGASSYAGTTTVSAGTLVAGANAASGAVGAFGNATSTITLGNAATATGNTSPTLLIGGAFTVARTITVAAQTTTGVYSIGGGTDNNATFSGAISLNEPLTISQVANAGSNALTISGGIAAASGTPVITFAGPGNIEVATNAIGNGSGTVSVNVTGGTDTFNAASTYSGGTTISAGTLLATNASGSATGTGGVALDGGTLGGSGSISGTVTVAGGTLAPGAAGTTLTVGGLTFDSGTLSFTLVGTGGTPTSSLVDTASATFSAAPTLNISYINISNGEVFTLLTSTGGAIGGSGNLAGLPVLTIGRITLTPSVSGNSLIDTASGSAASLVWAGGVAGLSTTTAPQGDGSTWNNTQNSGGSNWNNGGKYDYFYNLDSVTFNDTGSPNHTVNLTTANSPGSVTVNTGSTYTFSGAGSIAGSGSLLLSGGTLDLGTVNTYSGGTTINAGDTLQTEVAAALPSSGTVTVAGTLDLNGNNQSIGAFSDNGSATTSIISTTGTPTLTVNNGGTISGTTTLGTLGLTVSGGTLNITGNLAGGTTIATSGAGVISESAAGTIGGASTGFTQGSSGTSTLPNANTYGGLTTVSAGTLIASNNAALGNSSSATGGLLLNPSTSATVDFTSSSPMLASLAGTSGGSIVLGNGVGGSPTTLTITGAGAGSGTTFNGVISDLPGGNAAAIGSLTLTGGSLTLGGANSYTGTTSINAGTLTLNSTQTTSGQTFLNGGALVINSGQALENSLVNLSSGTAGFGATPTSASFGGLEGSVNLSLSNTAATPAGVSLSLNTTGNLTYTGNLTGLGSVSLAGAGTQTLGGANTYTGTTNNGIGTLDITGSLGTSLAPSGGITTGNTALTTNSTMNLSGNGIYASALTLDSGAGSGTVTSVLDLDVTAGATTITGAVALNAGNGDGTGLTTVSGGTLTTGSLTIGRDSENFNGTLQTGANTAHGLYVNGGTLVDNGALGVGSGGNSTANMTVASGTATVTGLTQIARTATATRYDLLSVTGGAMNANGGIELGGLDNTSGADDEELLVTGGVLSLGTTGTLTFGGNTGSAGAGNEELLATGGTIYLGSGGIVNTAPAGGTQVVSLATTTIGANAPFSTTVPLGLTSGDTTTFQAANGGGTPESFTLGGAITGAGNVSITGGGAVTLSATNGYTGSTTVASATLVVSGSLSGTASVSVGNAGTLELSGPNAINVNAHILLSAGTLQVLAGESQLLGDLTVQTGASSLSLGTSGDVLDFLDSSADTWTGTLAITDWNGSSAGGGSDQVYIGGTEDGGDGVLLTPAQLADITFVNGTLNGDSFSSAGAIQLADGEIVAAVPEPGTWAMLLTGVAMLGIWRRSRRRATRRDA